MNERVNSTLAPVQKNFVGKRLVRIADILNTTGVYTFLKSNDAYQQGKAALADVVSGLIERKMNEKFHRSLSFLEKMGFLSDSKLQSNRRKVAFGQVMTTSTILVLSDVLPMILDHVHRTKEFRKLIDFYVGWLAYVNQEAALAVQNRVVRLYKGNLREYDHKRYLETFQEYSGKRPGLLPPVPPSMSEHPETLFMNMVAGCDLRKDAILERSNELGEYLGLSTDEVKDNIAIVLDGGEVVSDLTGFAGFSMETMFKDLVKDIDQASEAAVYVVENDPYHAIRHARKRRILQGTIGLAGAAATLVAGPTGDMVIAASAPIILQLMSTEPSPAQVVEVHRRLLELKNKIKDHAEKE